MLTILALIGLIGLCVAMHILAMALMSRLLRAPIKECNLFFGPAIFRTTLWGAPFIVRCIPFGGSIDFHEGSDAEIIPLAFGDQLHVPDVRRGFTRTHPLHRVAIILVGCAVLATLAAGLLGFAEGCGAIARGFIQMPAAACMPFSFGKRYVSSACEVISSLPVQISLGLTAAKLTATCLIPLPGLNGGDCLIHLFRWRQPTPTRAEQVVRWIGVLVCLLFFLGLGLSVVAYLVS